MIRVKIEQKQGSVSRTVSVIAPSIERALALAGEGRPGFSVRVLFPIDPEAYFASAGNAAEGIDYEAMTADEIEAACEAGLPGAYEAWTNVLKDDLGEEGFERYALENCLIQGRRRSDRKEREMETTTLMKEGPPTEIPDPHAVPYPEGPVWDRLGHELVYGREPEEVAKEYGEGAREVERLSRLFWDGFDRSVWLAEAEEYGLLDERLVMLESDELHARLEDERRRRDRGA